MVQTRVVPLQGGTGGMAVGKTIGIKRGPTNHLSGAGSVDQGCGPMRYYEGLRLMMLMMLSIDAAGILSECESM